MKKMNLVLLATVSLMAITSCGGSSSSVETTSNTSETEITLDKVIENLKKSMTFEGELRTNIKYLTTEENEPLVFGIETKVEEDSYQCIEKEGTIVSSVNNFYNIDNKLMSKELSINNEVINIPVLTSTNQELPYDNDYWCNTNPFLKYNSGYELKDNKLVITELNSKFASHIFTNLTGYAASEFESIKYSINKVGIATDIELLSKPYVNTDYNIEVTHLFNASIGNVGKTFIDEVEPLESLEGQEKIDLAFQQLKNNNYTVKVSNTSSGRTSIYKAFITENATYSQSMDAKNYVKAPDGGLGTYILNPQDETVRLEDLKTAEEKTYDSSIAQFNSKKELFTPLENNEFNAEVINKKILEDIGLHDDSIIRFVLEGSLKLKLDEEGKTLKSLTYDYSTGGMGSGTILYEFSDIGTTSLPLDLSHIFDEEHVANFPSDVVVEIEKLFGRNDAIPYLEPNLELTWYPFSGEKLSISTYFVNSDWSIYYVEELKAYFASYEQLLLDKGFVKGEEGTTSDTMYTGFNYSKDDVNILLFKSDEYAYFGLEISKI